MDVCREHQTERCIICAQAADRRRILVIFGVLATLVLGGVATAVAMSENTAKPQAPKTDAPPARKESALAKRLRARLDREPCSRRRALKLAEQLLHDDEGRAVIELGEAFWKRCGEFGQLRWKTFAAHKSLSQWDAAIVDVTKLMRENPYDKDFPWWRGQVYEQKGELDAAARDYRRALSNQPRLDGIPFNLATVLEKQGRHCEAIFPLEQFLHFHPRFRSEPRIATRLDGLRNRPECKSLRVSGSATIRFQPGAPVIKTEASINGSGAGQVIVDTGASVVTLSRSFAQKLGLKVGKPNLKLHVVGGIREATWVVLDSVKLGGAEATRVDAVVVDKVGPDTDALVGLSFLSRFKLVLDPDKGVLELKPRL